MKAAMASYFPWPYWWPVSAGSSDFFNAIKLNSDAAISKIESTAEDKIEREPVTNPTTAFDTARQNATVIATFVALVFSPFLTVASIYISFFIIAFFFKPLWFIPYAK